MKSLTPLFGDTAISTRKCASAWLLSWTLDWRDVLVAVSGSRPKSLGTSDTTITTEASTRALSTAPATGLPQAIGGAAFPAGGKPRFSSS
jgi:hypothetical protein